MQLFMKLWLQKIVENPEREVSWLQTLSLLESIGARKIAKTVGQGSPSPEVLEDALQCLSSDTLSFDRPKTA